MKVKKPATVRWCHPAKGFAVAHRVQTGDSFVTLASRYGFSDPWDIIQFNYGTRNPEEVNWYLQELVGCSKSKDGINYSFDSSDRFGVVYIPAKGWKPGQPYETHAYSTYKESPPKASSMPDVPYINESKVRQIFRDRIFLVGDENLRVPVEYNYGNIMFVRMRKRVVRREWTSDQYFDKELLHLAYGVHGMNMSYSLRTEAVALIGAFVMNGMLKSDTKLPPNDEFFLSPPNRNRMRQEIETFLAQYKKSHGSASIDGVVRLLTMEPQLTRRLSGSWVTSQAA